MDKQRVLIVHQNFPGQFRHLAQHLARRPDVELLCIGDRTAPGLPGVPLRRYATHRAPKPGTHPYLRQMEHAVLRGQAMAREMRALGRRGLVPDVIVAHPGWGETMYAKDIFPDTRLVHFCEWFYGSDDADVDFDSEFPTGIDARLRARTWNALHTLNLALCDRGVAPTQWQKSRHPRESWPKIEVIHEGVDTDEFRPDPGARFTLPGGQVLAAGDPVLTYVARNLEPYRGFHVFMRALQHIQRQHPRCQAVIAGGDGVSYGARPRDAAHWREKMLREVKLDPARTHFTGWLDRTSYRRLLQVSAVHVYLTYPFVLSWSMLEAMAAGCLLVASDVAPVREFVQDGVNGWLVPFGEPAAVARQVLRSLNSATGDAGPMRREARAMVRTRCDASAAMRDHLQLAGIARGPSPRSGAGRVKHADQQGVPC